MHRSLPLDVSILADDAQNSLRMLHRNAETDGSTVIKNIHVETVDTQLIQKAIHYLSQMVEGVLKLIS